MSYTELGIGTGYIYATNPTSNQIHLSIPNTAAGVRTLREFGLKARSLGLGQRGVGIIEIGTITDAGTISQVIIGAQNQIGSSVAYDVGEEEDVALALATAISVYTPGSGLNYFAQAVGAFVYVYPPQNATTAINGSAITVADTGDITITTTAISGVSGQETVYNVNDGYRFYINSATDAPVGSISGADEITKWIIPRTLDMSLPLASADLVDDVFTIERQSSISFGVVGTEGSVGDDDCVAITPVGWAENDLLILRSVSSARTVNFIQDVSGNLIMQTGSPYTSSGADGYIAFQYMNGIFYEMFRSGGTPNYIIASYSLAAATLAASQLIPGCTYLISDRGDRGIVLRADTANSFSLYGTYLAAVPDYQNVSGLFIGRWTASLSPSPNDLTAWENLMYVNTTGANGASNPTVDTTNWTVRALATANEYVVESHYCEYNFGRDWIQRRIDGRGNDVAVSYEAQAYLGSIGVSITSNYSFFVWGKDSVYGNKFVDSSWASNVYTDGVFANNTLINYSLATISMALSNNVVFSNNMNTGRINITFANSGSAFSGNEVINCRVNLDETSGSGVDVSTNRFKRAGTRSSIGSSSYVNLEVKDYFRNSVVDDVTSSQGIPVRPESGQDFEGYVFFGRESSFYNNISVTGVTTLPPQSGGRNIGGTLRLTSSNATESVNLIDYNPATSIIFDHYILVPGSALELTLVGTAYGSVSANGQIVIPQRFWDDTSPSGSDPGGEVTIDGATGDYLVVKRITIGAFTCFVVENVIQL